MRFYLLSVALSLASCSSTAPSSPAAPSTSAPPRVVRTTPEEAEAKKAYEEFIANKAPRPSGRLTKEETEAFIGGPLRDWYGQAVSRLENLQKKYAALLGNGERPEWVGYSLDVAKASLHLSSEFIAAGASAFPDEWKDNPEFSAGYLRSLENAIEPFRDHARGTLDVCLRVGVHFHLENEEVEQCRELARRLNARR